MMKLVGRRRTTYRWWRTACHTDSTAARAVRFNLAIMFSFSIASLIT